MKKRVKWKTAAFLILMLAAYSAFAVTSTMPTMAEGSPTPSTPNSGTPIAPLDGDPIPGGPNPGGDN